MELNQLTAIAKDLKEFVDRELLLAKAVQGFDLKSFEVGAGLIHEVIDRIDELKTQFKDITNEQCQQLAVDAVYSLFDIMLATRLGVAGKIVSALLPNKLKRKLCAMVVDMIVKAMRRTKAKLFGQPAK